MTRNRLNSGMTLMEVLFALVVAALLGGMVVGLLIRVQKGTVRFESLNSRSASARLVIQDIAQSIESAFPFPSDQGIRFLGTDNGDAADELTLVIPARNNNNLEFQEIHYSAMGPRIAKETKNAAQPGAPYARAPLGLAMNENVPIKAGLNIQYQAPDGDKDSWSPANLRFPDAVRVTVTLEDPRYPDDKVTVEQTIRPRTRLAP